MSRDSYPPDPHAARGIMVAVLLGVSLWGIILGGGALLWRLLR